MKLEDFLKPPSNKYNLNSPTEDYDPPIREGDIGITIEDLPGKLESNQPDVENDFFHEINKTVANNIDKQFSGELFPDYLINDPEIVGYPDKEMQEEIYEWVIESLPSHNFSIKDLGSGRCDFYDYMSISYGTRINASSGISYHGIDSNPNLCNVAKYKYPNVNVINNNYFDVNLQTDYTILIGTLNTNNGNSDKWDNFNKTLIYALNNTNKAIIFVLARNMDGLDGYFDYPFEELFQHLHPALKFTIDYSKFEDIYKLVVHIDNHNN